jgi:hypothetical protein
MNPGNERSHMLTPSSAFDDVGLAHEGVVYAPNIQHFRHGTSEYGDNIKRALVANEQELHMTAVVGVKSLLELSAHQVVSI